MITYEQRGSIIAYENPVDVVERNKILNEMMIKYNIPKGFNEFSPLFKVPSYKNRYNKALKETYLFMKSKSENKAVIKPKESEPVIIKTDKFPRALLAKYNLPEDFNENHPLMKAPSYRNRWNKLKEELNKKEV